MQTFENNFETKTVIVTGAGSGLGEAIARLMAGKSAKVVLTDINLASAQRVAYEIHSEGGTASAIEQDTAKPQDSERIVKHAVGTYGALH